MEMISSGNFNFAIQVCKQIFEQFGLVRKLPLSLKICNYYPLPVYHTSEAQLPISFQSPLQLRAAMLDFWQLYARKRREPEYGINPIEYLNFMLENEMLFGWTFENLNEEYPEEPHIIGICDMRENMILLDNKLKDGNELWRRRSFTIVHEIAHWVLHKPLYDSLCKMDEEPSCHTIVCRSKDVGLNLYHDHQSRLDAKIRMEWQANTGGSVLLFPPHKIKRFARDFRQMLREDKRCFIEQCALLFHASLQATEIALRQHGII